MSLSTYLREQLALANIPFERFRELVDRLLAYGVVVRDEDRTEQLLYDDARRVERLLVEYFEVAGMVLHHDLNAGYFRLYAPGAVADGVREGDAAPAPSLRAKLSVDFVAAALALRFIYQERLTQGRVDDGGEVFLSFEDLAAAMQSQLKRALPASLGERMALLQELKRHRILRFSTGFSPTDADAVLAIRPLILGVVTNEALAAVVEEEGVDEAALRDAADSATVESDKGVEQ